MFWIFTRASRHRVTPTRRLTSFLAILCTLFTVLVFQTVAAPRASAVTAFSSVFSANIEGDITMAANANMTCPTGCTTANSAAMVMVDADGAAASPLLAGGTIATFNSSSADIVVPAGSTLLYAGLFWGGNTLAGTGGANAPAVADTNKIMFRLPGSAGYQQLTATQTDVDTNSSAAFPVYHSYRDVTALLVGLPNAGAGTYWGSNIQAGTGSSGLGDWAGWSLVLAYSNPAEQLRHLNVFNGFERVFGATTASSADVLIGPFVTPAVGPVRTKIGLVVQDGDPGILNDYVTLVPGGAGSCSSATTAPPALTDAANPTTNVFNSSISTLGADVTTRNPAPAITWGYDADIIQADNYLTNGSTNGCIRLNTTGDTYYADAVFLSTELPTPEIVATKTGFDVNGGNLDPGDVIEYTVALTNNGNDPAINLVLTDPMPANTTYVPGSLQIATGANAGAKTDSSADADVANFTGSTATFYLGTGATSTAGGSLAPTASTSIKLRATVNSATPGGTAIVNTANVTYRGATIPTQVLAPVSSPATTPLALQTDLVVTKTDGVGSVIAGSAHSYTVTVKNNGPQAVTNTAITDTIPTMLLTPTWTCSVAGQSVAAACGAASGSGNIASTVNLGVGDTATYTINGTIDPAAPAGTGTLANTALATVAAGVTDTNLTNNTATDTDNVTRSSDIAVTKTDGITNAVPGTSVTYTVTATNNGPSNAGLVAIADTVPAAITGVTWTCTATAGSACTAASGSGNAIATSATLIRSGVATYTITGTLAPGTPAGTGTLVNSVTATLPVGVTEINAANNTAQDIDNVTPRVDLSTTKTDGLTDAVPGTVLTYTVTVANAGPSTATNATITDTVPAAITGVTWTCAATGAGATCGAASGSGNAIATTATMPTGTSVTYTVSGTLNPTTPSGLSTLVNTATAAAPSGTTETNATNNAATDTDNVKATADLVITKNDGLTNAVPGTVVTYTIVASNLGPSTVTAASINDTVPASITGVTWTCAPSGATAACGAPSGTGNTISTTATIAAGASVTYTVTGTLLAATPFGTNTLANTATATAPVGVTEAITTNNSATDTDNVTPTVDLSITKTDGITAAVPGTPITYTIVASNAGPSTATNATITDTVPAAITGVTWTCSAAAGSSCGAPSGSGNTIATSATIVTGAPVTYTVTGTVAATTPAGIGTLVNTAVVGAPTNTVELTPLNNSATDTDDVTPRADLAITKTVVPTSGIPGTAVAYTIVVTNNGPSTVTGASVVDNVPTTINGVAWTCAASGVGAACATASGSGNAIATTANLATGTSVTYTVNGTIAAGTLAGTITNTASVSAPSGTTDPTPANNSAFADVTVGSTADLSITKSDGVLNATPGTSVTYTIVGTNGGPNPVTGATIVDNLPAQITSATWTCVASAGSSCGVVSGSGSINQSVNLLAGGTVTYTLIAAIAPGATGSLVNSATIAVPAGVTETNTGNNIAGDTDTLTASGDLAISKTDGVLTKIPGTPITYTIVVTNNGPSTAVAAAVNDTIPATILSPTWTCVASAGSSCALASGSGNIASTVTLTPTGTATYTVNGTVDPDATGTLTNTATVTGAVGFDGTVINNSAQDVDTLTPTGDLTITKTDGITDAVPGTSITYTIVATNSGPSTVVSAPITDTLPAALTGATWTCVASAGSSCGAPSGSGNLATTATLRTAGTATYTVTATVLPSTPAGVNSLTNTANIAAPAGFTDPAPGNNTGVDTDNVTPRVDLISTKTDGITQATPGTLVNYAMTVTNSGPSQATNAAITDTVPASLTGVTWTCTATGGATCAAPSGSGNIIATNATIPTGGIVTYTVTGTLDPTTPAGTATLINKILATPPPGTTETDNSNNEATDTDDVTPRGDLSITKTDGLTNAVPGTNVVYTIVATNSGPSTATGATITDTLPSALSGATWTCVATLGASCGAASGTGNLATTATLPTGGVATYTVTALLAATTPAGTGTLVNTATVGVPAGFTDTGVTANNSATDTDNVTPRADLSVTKNDGITDAVPGTTVTYTIVASNAGPSFSTATAITDTVPAALTGVTWTCAATVGSTCAAASGSGNTISTTAGIAVGGTATYTVSGTLNPNTPAGTNTLINIVNVAAGAGTTDPVTTNNQATDTDNVTPRSDIGIAKTRTSAAPVAGLPVTYQVVASNAGPSNVIGALITDTIPAHILSPTWTCVSSGGSGCASSAGSGSLSTTANLLVGGTATYTITGTVDPTYVTGNVANTATIAPPVGTTDTTPLNNSSTVTDPVSVRTDLAVVKNRAAALVAGANATYTIDVTNNGPSSAINATLVDPIPAGLTSFSWTCSTTAGGSCGAATGTGAINTTYSLPLSGVATYTVTAAVAPGATAAITNTATVAAAVPANDPITSNNVANNVGTPTQAVDLKIVKTDGKTTIVAGTANSYTLTVTNTGPSDAVGATVSDTMPANFTGATWTCTASAGSNCPASGSGNVSATVTVLVGGTATFTVNGTVSATSPLGPTALANTATVTAPATSTEATPLDNTSTDTDAVTGAADLAISKTDGSLTEISGTSVTYTIVATNNGPSFVTGATVVDNLPATITGATWTCAASAGGSCATASGSGNINQTVNLPVGGTATYTLTGTIAAGATGSLANTATVSAPSGVVDGTPGNNQATDTDTLSATADLSIVKSNGVNGLIPGNATTYTITVSNAGPSTISGATVTDTYPATLIGATWTCAATAGASCGTASGSGNINQTINIAPTSTVTYTVTGTVSAAATGSIANTAAVAVPATATDPTPLNNSATDTDPLNITADLSVTKTDGQTTAVPGAPITYTMVVTNNGPSNVTGATVADTLPADLVSPTWTCVASAGSTCPASGAGNISHTVSLPVGGTATYTVNATVSSSSTGNITNTITAAVPSGATDPIAINNSATDVDGSTPTADISISKTDGTLTETPGTPVTYTIVATNSGPSSVTGMTVADTLPSALSGATWTCSATAGSTCPASGTGNINASVDLLTSGTATFTLTANIAANATGSLSNTAAVTLPVTVTDPTLGNNSATDVDTLGGIADLRITKTDGQTTDTAGTSISYTIVASNLGPSNVIGATVTDTIPATLSGTTWTCVATAGATCAASGTGNINDTINIAVGSTATYTVTANIVPGATGVLSNTAAISVPSGTTDPTSLNNSAIDTTTLSVSNDLSVTKTDGSLTEVPGTPVTYTVVVTNNGPSAAVGATVTDTLPATLTGANWTCTASAGGSCAASGTGNINDTVNLPLGGTATYTLNANVSPSATGSVANTASALVAATATDPISANNSATDLDTLNISADVAITKTDGSATEVPGTPVTYTIVATNNGPSAVTGATVSDTLPATLTGATWTCVASAGATCAASGTGNISDTVNLALGATATYTLTANVSSSATVSIANTATVAVPAAVSDPTPLNNSATDTDTLNASADMSVTKTDGSLSEIPGTPVTYTIVATNNGPSAVTGATVTDTLPATLTGATWSCVASSGGTCVATSGTGNIATTVSLPNGGTATFTLTANIASTATGSLANTVTVGVPSGTTDSDTLNNAATDTDTLNATADVQITKTDGVATTVAGNTIVYTIVASNNGPSAVTGATVTDTLPATLTGATWSCVAAGGATCAPTGAGNISDTINLPVGGTATYTLTATLASNATGTVANTAAIAVPATVTDLSPLNNSATDTDTITRISDLAISKTDSSATAVPGNTVTYTIVASNNGPSNVTGATVTDTLPATLTGATWTCVATVGATCAASGSGNISDTVNIAVGSTATYTLNATVSSSATGSLANSAAIGTPIGTTDPIALNNSATDTNTLTPRADMAITKTDGSLTEVSGTSVTYTIVATNNGPSFVTGATIVDNLPAAITGATWTCAASAGGSCAAPSGSGNINQTANLPVGGTATYTLTGNIAANATGSLANTATVGVPTGTTDPSALNNQATDTDTLGQTADVQITKTDGIASTIAGNAITYTIVASNVGPSNVVGATITDTLPATLTGATWSCVAAGGATCAATGTGNINDTINLPIGATATYTLTATLASSATGTVANTAAIAVPATVTDPTPLNNSATDTDTITRTADLRITKTDSSATATAGSPITYTIVASNLGPSNVTGATIADTLPATLTGGTWTCVATAGATCAATGTGNITDTINLAVGATATYTLTATLSAAATGTIANQATVSAPTGTTDPSTLNNSATDTDTVTKSADLGVTKTDGVNTVVPGGPITYTIVVNNSGPSNVIGGSVTDTMPVDLVAPTWTCVATGSASCAASGTGNINDTVNIAVGATLTYTVDATVSASSSGNVVNTVDVATPVGTTDPAPGNNSATDVDGSTPTADVQITKTDGSLTETPGTTVTYTIVARNVGPSAVSGVTVTDTLPSTLSGATWTCAASAGAACPTSGTGNIGALVNLPVNGTATFTLTATIAANATGTLSNTAVVTLPVDVIDPTTGEQLGYRRRHA